MTNGGDDPVVRTIGDIPGWFSPLDRRVFDHFLADGPGVPGGDLVELGVYLGKSAALIGGHLRPGETFTVCDLFGGERADPENATENHAHYAGLTRRRFESNYQAINGTLPAIIEAPSSAITGHVAPDSVRFMHVDASHLYAQVATDVDSARALLQPGGVVAFDDFRSAHTPGVAAAVWEAVFTKQLRLICLTDRKFYGTFDDPLPHQRRLAAWLRDVAELRSETQSIAGTPVIRIFVPTRPAARQLTRTDLDDIQNGLRHLTAQVSELNRGVGVLRHRRSHLERAIRKVTRGVHAFSTHRP